MDLFILIPVLFIFLIIIIYIKVISEKKSKKNKRKGRYNYVLGQFSEQTQIDMRLPYKRFKELYPENKWTYNEYKLMQQKTAFRRSYSSQENKRMVR